MVQTLPAVLTAAAAFALPPIDSIDLNALAREHASTPTPPHLREGGVPKIEALPPALEPDERRALAQSLIQELCKVSGPVDGVSGSFARSAFAPLPDLGEVGFATFGLDGTPRQESEAFEKLVALGPDALPFLLESLSDATPTGHTVRGSDFGAMWRAQELSGNPLDDRERKIIEARDRDALRPSDRTIQEHVVTVGDLCFVALGQITGRGYCAVRPQPTACKVVNSPTADPELAVDVRAIWESANPRQRLLDSLLVDFHTDGVVEAGRGMDGWHIASDIKCAGATRLLYYFPEETEELLVDALACLDVQACVRTTPEGEVPDWRRRAIANGVDAPSLLRAVAWSDRPAIHRAVLEVLSRTDDWEIVAACTETMRRLPAAERLAKLGALLSTVAPETQEGAWAAHNLLQCAVDVLGDESRLLFERFLGAGDAPSRAAAIPILARSKLDFARAMLVCMLDDARPTRHSHPVSNPPNSRRSDEIERTPTRVCDLAAYLMRPFYPDCPFDMLGTPAQLDERLAVFRRCVQRADAARGRQ